MANSSTKKYDFIFLGAGCASLSILMRMIDSGKFNDKNILLVDRALKNKNDRTWCFWEKEDGYFEPIVHRKWDHLQFRTEKFTLPLDIAPYQYKMIRGIDFYKHCFSKIASYPNIETTFGNIVIEKDNILKINEIALPVNSTIVFNSVYQPGEKVKNKFYLLQHFKGWIIETSVPYFEPGLGTLMDFSVPQNWGTSFVYVLPLTGNKALIEYTLFSENLLLKQNYDTQLQNYINGHLAIKEFTITEEEFGIIPMTNANFAARENGMFNIGTAGGQTKASTGYTFQFIQKHATQVVEDIIAGKYFFKKLKSKKRFNFYDSTLLHILSGNKLKGKEIFTHLFQRNKAAEIFKFLDNATTLREELKIINTLPKKEFLKAGIRELLKMM